jgi:hypothetical protein
VRAYAALLALVVAVPANAAASPADDFTIASGRWYGQAFAVRVADYARRGDVVQYCLRLRYPGEIAPFGCGGFVIHPLRVAKDAPFGVGGTGRVTCPGLAIYAGAVVDGAREVTVTLASGRTLRGRTFAPPAGHARGVRFYVLHARCERRPPAPLTMRDVVARDAAGHVVGRFRLHRTSGRP